MKLMDSHTDDAEVSPLTNSASTRPLIIMTQMLTKRDQALIGTEQICQYSANDDRRTLSGVHVILTRLFG